jgi:ferredoxin
MPKIEVEGKGAFEVDAGARLVNAIEAAGVDILHRCGGYARCTTCRVEFIAGEPAKMTEAEKAKLAERELLGQARLACQIACDHDMSLRVLQTVTSSGLPDPGGAPEKTITPEPVWVDR